MNDKATAQNPQAEDKKHEKKEKPEKYLHPETGVEISKNEFKKLEKQKKKDEELKKKQEEKVVKQANEPTKVKKTNVRI